jgi:hypothetical protein
MTQITIVDHLLDFTDISAASAAPVPETPAPPEHEGRPAAGNPREQQRIARELRSILIRGRLPE